MSLTVDAAAYSIEWAMRIACGEEQRAQDAANEWIFAYGDAEAGMRVWYFASAAPLVAVRLLEWCADGNGKPLSGPGRLWKYVAISPDDPDADPHAIALIRIMAALLDKDATMALELLKAVRETGGFEALFTVGWAAICLMGALLERNPNTIVEFRW